MNQIDAKNEMLIKLVIWNYGILIRLLNKLSVYKVLFRTKQKKGKN